MVHDFYMRDIWYRDSVILYIDDDIVSRGIGSIFRSRKEILKCESDSEGVEGNEEELRIHEK